MRMLICCLLIWFAGLAWASPNDVVTNVDPVEWEKWEWRAARAEKQLSKEQWAKADKTARSLGRDIIDGQAVPITYILTVRFRMN